MRDRDSEQELFEPRQRELLVIVPTNDGEFGIDGRLYRDDVRRDWIPTAWQQGR